MYSRSKDDEGRRARREPQDRRHRPLLGRVRLDVWIEGHDRSLQYSLRFCMAQERELKARNWAGGLDCLVFSTRDDTVVFEADIKTFFWVQSSKS